MERRPQLSRIAGGLVSAADAPYELPLAVAYSADGAELEMLAPPVQLTASPKSFAVGVLGGLLDQFGPGGLSTVGVLVPATSDADGFQPCSLQGAHGMLVCAAERGIGGAVSAALFRPHREVRWREAHADAGWICAALRALVSEEPLETSETRTMPSTIWDSTRLADDDGDSDPIRGQSQH